MTFKKNCFIFIFASFIYAPLVHAADLNSAEIVAKWAKAVHAPAASKARSAELVTKSNEDGIPGNVRQLIDGTDYHRAVKREFDESETLVTRDRVERRDWNGFIRHLQGNEAARLRTSASEMEAIVFGPPAEMKNSQISWTDDHQFYVLRFTPAEGEPIAWYIDAKNGLPAKSIRPGNDTEITTTYSNWEDSAGRLLPKQAHVSETEKPDYDWQFVSLKIPATLSKHEFDALKPGPPDVKMSASVPPVPFNFENSHIMLKLSLNGREPIWFLLDTGADQEVINEPRMAEFGMKTYAKSATTGGGNSAEYSYALGATFSLPGIEVQNQHVAVIDQTGLETALGMKMGGLLGYDFISRFVIEIDYEKKLITLHDPKNWNYSGHGFVVPVVFDEGIPFTNGSISVAAKTIPAFLVMDFGAAETTTLTSPFVKANNLLTLAQTNANVNRPAGLEKQFFAQTNVRGHIDALTVGKLSVHSIPINLSMNTTGAYASKTFSGTVGQGTFHRYHVFLDYARDRMIFEPTAESEKPFPERLTYGLRLLASGTDLHTYTVSEVRPVSPAEKDGFQKGDVIAGIDQKPANEFTLGELRDDLLQDGAKHQMEIVRGGQKMTLPITVRVISLDAK